MALAYAVGAVILLIAMGAAWFGITCLPCLRNVWDHWQEERKQGDPLTATLVRSNQRGHQEEC